MAVFLSPDLDRVVYPDDTASIDCYNRAFFPKVLIQFLRAPGFVIFAFPGIMAPCF